MDHAYMGSDSEAHGSHDPRLSQRTFKPSDSKYISLTSKGYNASDSSATRDDVTDSSQSFSDWQRHQVTHKVKKIPKSKRNLNW
jgi:hypothetical protein